jgi:RND superfamily putative drug exporter
MDHTVEGERRRGHRRIGRRSGRCGAVRSNGARYYGARRSPKTGPAADDTPRPLAHDRRMESQERLGTVARVARWCAKHRRRTLAAWIVALVAVGAAASAVGTHAATDFALGGTESQRAQYVLDRDFPARAGDVDQVVFHTRQGRITDADVRARIAPALAKIARLPHVASVTSPYGPGGAQSISRDGRIAFATLTFDEQAADLPKAAVERVISTADAAHSPDLHVALGGAAIEETSTTSLGSATAIGLAAAIVVLLLAFGSLLAAGLPVVTALLGLGTAFGVIALASHAIKMPDVSTELAAMIGLGVGIDYSLFIVTRFREGRRSGEDVRSATTVAMDTAGRAVLFAGTTVIIALLGMIVLGLSFLDGMAIASAVAVLLTMLAALTLLPALLSWVGARVGRVRRMRTAPARAGSWGRWARGVQRHPWAATCAGLAIMLVVAIPALSMQMGFADAGNDPAGNTTREAYDLLARGFGPGFNGPLSVVVELPQAHDTTALGRIGGALQGTPDVAGVSAPTLSRDGRTAVYQVFPRSAPQESATTDLVNALRGDVLAPVARQTDSTVLVGGLTASAIDFTHVLSAKLPLFIAVVVGLAALLLLVVFRSFVIPIQAACMNLLSIAAALGVTVAVFQHGWLGGLVGVEPGPIEPWLPVMVFAIVFGLSMDYEVFLVSRIHEEWMRRRDPSRAVVEGLATTGRVITAAATIMICVFLAFVLGPERQIKQFGLSLAVAVFLDAFVVRSLLLPAVLELLGRRTWAFPAGLARRLPGPAPEPAPGGSEAA